MKKTSKCNKAIFDRNQVYGFVPEAAHSIVLETRASSYGIKSKFLCASVQDNFNECVVKPQGVNEVPKRTSHSFTAWPNVHTLSYPTIGASHNQNKQMHNVSRTLRAVEGSNNKNHDDDFSHNVSFALPEDKYVMINGEMVEVIPQKALHETPEEHTHLRSTHHDDDFSSDVSRTLTVDEVTGELDSIELCIKVMQTVSDKMCDKYNACDNFFDDSYGLTGIEETPDDYPYKDEYVVTEIDSGQLTHERNDWELNIRCGHMYWEECNIIRRHGVNQLPVYVYDLPDTQYNSSTNTIHLHGEMREWIEEAVTRVTKDPKVRHRTWGNVKRRVKVTNTDSPHWLIHKYGHIHFDEWHLLDKMERGVFDSPVRSHAETAYLERGFNSTSGYVCLGSNCLQTFPRVSLDTSFFYCLLVIKAIIYVLSFLIGFVLTRLYYTLLELWDRFDVWLLPFHPNSDVEDDEQETRYIPQRDCHLSDRAKIPHYYEEYCKRQMDDEDVDPLEAVLDTGRALVPPLLTKWVSTLYSLVVFWLRYIFTQYCSYRTRRIITCSVNEVNKWRNSLFTIITGNMSKDDKLRWIEIKSTLHFLYYAYNGDKAGAAGWLSNFVITKREWVGYVSSLPYDQVKKLFEEPTAEVVIDGRPVRVDSKTWEAILSRYEDDPLHPDYDSMDFAVKPNAGFMESAVTWAWDQLDPGLKGLSASDIRDANYQFTFMKNRRSENDRKLAIATNIISSVGRVLFGVDPFDPEYMSFISSMISIIEYSRQSLLRRQDLCTDRQFMTATLLKADESMLIFNNPRVNEAPRFLQTSYRKAHEDLQNMCSEALRELAGSEQRYEPTSILLTGPPAVGKSAFTRAAMKALCRMDGLSYDNTMMFTRAADSDYWDGYNKQKFVVVDDLWKSADMSRRGEQTEDVVSMINTARFSLNMAFGDKGKVTFDSEYVFFSTNLANRGIDGATLQIQATDNEAIKRRFHIVLHKDTKLEKGMNIMHQLWRIDACPYPELVHAYTPMLHNTVDVIKMIKRVREDSIKDALINEISDETIDELFQLNAGKDSSVDGTYSRLMVLGLYEWSDSPYSKYFVAMFAVLTVCAIMAPVLRYMFPIDVNSHPGEEVHENSAYVFENGKWVHWKKSTRQGNIDAQNEAMQDFGLPGKKQKYKFTPNSCRENFEESLVKRVSKSMMYISAHALGANGERMDYSSCVASHLMNGWILTCAHWYHTYRDYHEKNILCELYIRIGEKVYNMPFPVGDDVKVVQEADVVCIKLPTTVPLIPQLMKDIMSCDSLRQLKPGTAMTVYRVDRDGQCRFKTVTSVTQTSPISYSSPLFHIIVEEPIAYFDNSSSGESGSLLIAEGPNGKVVIVGMHVGNKPVLFGTKLSYATPLIRENLEEFLKEDQELHTNSAPPGFPLEITEHVGIGEAYYPSRVSRLKQSDVNGWDGPPVCIPAKLNEFARNGVKYNPLYIALQKIRQTPFPSFVMPERIFDHVLCTYPRKVGSRLLTMSEAINGVSALHIPSIRLRTSPGYPYTLLRNKPGKFSFIESVDGVLVPTDKLKADVESMLLAYVDGKPPRILFADSLKDETRLIEKVHAGKTRVISSVPLPYLVLVRMYFGDFVSYVQSTPTTRPVCVGINVHSLDWNRLYNRMCSTSGSVFSCDFSNFDGSIPAFLNEVFAEFVNRWYNDSDENKRVRKGLLSATNNAYHIVYDMIYQASGGGPSGEPITSVANSFKVYFALSYVLIFNMGLKEGDFNAALYGDDTFGTTKQKGITWKHLVDPFKDLFGFTLTHCTKKDTDVVDTMDNVEFLSRKFVNGKYAPLPIKTITEMTYWRRGNTAKDVVLLSTVRSFFAELSHYPIEVFNKYCDKFLAHMQQNEDVAHLAALAADERKSWWYYDEWKYNPRPDQAPMALYYGEEGWGNYVELGYEPDFQPNSGKPDPVRMGTHDTEPTSFAVNRDLAPIITQKDQLGGMMDVNPVTTEFVDPHMTQQVHTSINMEGYDLDGALNRLYLLPCPVWSSAMASNTLLVTYLFPDEIFVQNFIIEKITDFRYFTADILIRVSVKSTEFGYGTLIVGFVPNINDVGNVPNTIYGLAGGHHVLVRAGAAESVEMLIPFIYPRRYLDMENYVAGDLGRVTIMVQNALRDIQGNPVTMDVIVTAQFVNAKLYFPDVTDGPTVSKILSYRNPDRKADIRRTRYDTLPRTVHFADSEEQDTVSEMSAVVVEHIDNFQVNSGRGEARTKSRWNSASNSLISSESVRSVVRVGQLVAPFAGTLMSTVSYIGKRVSGLSKPTTLALADVDKINPFSDLAYGKGIDTSLKLAMDPENAITTEPNVAGISHDEMDLLRVIMTPALAEIVTLNKGVAPVIVGQNGPILNPLRWTYVDWVSNNFFFWSGSMKYKIYINAGYFHDIQLVFWLAGSYTSPDDWSECNHWLVEVKGPTEVEFTLPYTSYNVTAAVGSTNNKLYVYPLSWSEMYNTVDTPIDLNIYKAGASDFRVHCLLDNAFTVNCNPRADFEKDFPMFAVGSKGYTTSGFVHGEEYTTIREIIHRPMSVGAVTAATIYTFASVSGTGTFAGLDKWSLLYYMWRGSMRFKLICYDSREVAGVNVIVAGQNLVGNYFSSPTNPVVEFTVPYYSNHLYTFTAKNSLTGVAMPPSTLQKTWMYKCGGDDFSFLFLKLPPSGYFGANPNDSKAAVTALGNYNQKIVYTTPLV